MSVSWGECPWRDSGLVPGQNRKYVYKMIGDNKFLLGYYTDLREVYIKPATYHGPLLVAPYGFEWGDRTVIRGRWISARMIKEEREEGIKQAKLLNEFLSG